MAQNKVEICGVNTSTLPVLDQEEKAELFKRIKAGDEEARELYIKGNLRLVLSVIRRFQNSSENPDDLFQIGCIGLIKAIDNFDTTLQVKFSTYAVPMIIGEIRRYLRDNNSIRVSRSLRDIAYKTIYTRENYMRQHLKEPTITEINKDDIFADLADAVPWNGIFIFFGKTPENFPGSGMIRAFRRAVSQQNSTSRGQPRLRQVWILITSFCFSSQMHIMCQ